MPREPCLDVAGQLSSPTGVEPRAIFRDDPNRQSFLRREEAPRLAPLSTDLNRRGFPARRRSSQDGSRLDFGHKSISGQLRAQTTRSAVAGGKVAPRSEGKAGLSPAARDVQEESPAGAAAQARLGSHEPLQ